MKKKSTNKKSIHRIKNSTSGITLIALVITIIVLLILAGASLSAVFGENGIINKAVGAKKEFEIASAKESIELAVLEMQMDKRMEKEYCSLEYMKENISNSLPDITIVGSKGNPISKLYVKQDGHQFEIRPDGEVVYIGDVTFSEVPDLAIIRNTTATGAEKVILQLNGDVEIGSINKIITPTGEITGTSGTYEITQNGEYKFTIVTDKDIQIEKTVNIQNIKVDGIDLTSLTTGENISHSHIYEDKYNETNHWKECILCEEKVNIETHNITTAWSLGDTYANSCRSDNIYTKTCLNCGYKEEGHVPCHWTKKYRNEGLKGFHTKHCDVCNFWIRNVSYYDDNTGIFYPNGENSKKINCTDSEGNILNCYNPGTCVDCGTNINNVHQIVVDTEKRKQTISYDSSNNKVITTTSIITCLCCETEFGTMNSVNTLTENTSTTTNNNYVITLTLNSDAGIKFNTINSAMSSDISGLASTNKVTATYNDDRTQAIVNINYITTGNSKMPVNSWIGASYKTLDETISYSGYLHPGDPHPDGTAPVINDIAQTTVTSLNNWSTSKTITVSGTENFSDTVNIKMLDSDNNTIYAGTASVSNSTYSLSFTPNIEVDANGKNFTIEVSDLCENISTKTFTVSKTDCKTPTMTSETDYTASWSNYKEVIITATDEGVGSEGSGAVLIGFNDKSDLQPADYADGVFSRKYIFNGDVYTSVTGAVYIQDILGNILTGAIKIDKIDGTSPTITSATKTGTILTIEANDLNTELQKEGSGIAGYAISTTKELPGDSLFQIKNTFEVEEGRTYYVWVKDNAGNFSEASEVN